MPETILIEKPIVKPTLRQKTLIDGVLSILGNLKYKDTIALNEETEINIDSLKYMGLKEDDLHRLQKGIRYIVQVVEKNK